MKIPAPSSGVVMPATVELVDDMVETVLKYLILSWDHVSTLPDVHANSLEVPVTEHLREELRVQVSRCPWGKGMLVIQAGSESKSDPALKVPDGITDIPLFHFAIYQRDQDHSPHMIVECKRIAGNDAGLCRKYVVEGMDRFIDGKYGARHRAGFMVGYVQAGTAAESVDRVNTYLTKNTRVKDCLSDLPQPEAWESNHLRASPMPEIHLRHAFLKTAPAPATATVPAPTATRAVSAPRGSRRKASA